ncbi:MAG: hypothetical protein KDI98_08260 [Hyphomicrobiaceae bacterium]|nr:hypothetical protein [Hyphomicrobiaceae bacterium]
MTIAAASSSSLLLQTMLGLRSQLDTLQTQLGSGKKAESYADLGSDRSLSLSLRSRISRIDTYETTIRDVTVRLDLMQTSLTRLEAIAGDTKADALPLGFTLQNGQQTVAQLSSYERLSEAVGLLNMEVEGRYFFSGRMTDTKPVVPHEIMLDGQGGKAGYRQVMNERRTADLGGSLTDATLTGRLDMARVDADIQISEQTGIFGFKMTPGGASSSTPTITINGPAGAPAALDVSVVGQPKEGDSIRIEFQLPDGTTSNLVMKATREGPVGTDEFLVGADPIETATNLEAALGASIDRLARTDLAAASAHQAGAEFFDENPPLRVVPGVGGLADATGLVADAANTVVWYQGEEGTANPREAALAKVDDTVTARYGARADEPGLRTVIKELSIFTAFTFEVDDNNSAERYTALTTRVRDGLDDPSGSTMPRSVSADIAAAQQTLASAKNRHFAMKGVLDELMSDVEGISTEEVAAKMLSVQTRLQASYSATAMLNQLSLANYL